MIIMTTNCVKKCASSTHITTMRCAGIPQNIVEMSYSCVVQDVYPSVSRCNYAEGTLVRWTRELQTGHLATATGTCKRGRSEVRTTPGSARQVADVRVHTAGRQTSWRTGCEVWCRPRYAHRVGLNDGELRANVQPPVWVWRKDFKSCRIIVR